MTPADIPAGKLTVLLRGVLPEAKLPASTRRFTFTSSISTLSARTVNLAGIPSFTSRSLGLPSPSIQGNFSNQPGMMLISGTSSSVIRMEAVPLAVVPPTPFPETRSRLLVTRPSPSDRVSNLPSSTSSSTLFKVRVATRTVSVSLPLNCTASGAALRGPVVSRETPSFSSSSPESAITYSSASIPAPLMTIGAFTRSPA